VGMGNCGELGLMLRYEMFGLESGDGVVGSAAEELS
jgi:hypothetical protein